MSRYRITPVAVLVAAVIVGCSTTPHGVDQKEETVTQYVSSRDGTSIAYEVAGTGPTLISVGGAFYHRGFPVPPGWEILEEHFTVVSYDRRGRGESGDTPPYAVAREIEDLAAIIDAMGGEAFVLGISSGAVLSLDAAAAGLPITRLALYEPPFIVDDSRAPLPDDYVTRLNAMIAEGRRGDAVEYFMTRAVGVPADHVAPMREMDFWPAFEEVAHTLSYDGTVMGTTMSGNPLPVERWREVTVPTLAIAGGASPDYQQRSVRALSEPPARRAVSQFGRTDPRRIAGSADPGFGRVFSRLNEIGA